VSCSSLVAASSLVEVGILLSTMVAVSCFFFLLCFLFSCSRNSALPLFSSFSVVFLFPSTFSVGVAITGV